MRPKVAVKYVCLSNFVGPTDRPTVDISCRHFMSRSCHALGKITMWGHAMRGGSKHVLPSVSECGESDFDGFRPVRDRHVAQTGGAEMSRCPKMLSKFVKNGIRARTPLGPHLGPLGVGTARDQPPQEAFFEKFQFPRTRS